MRMYDNIIHIFPIIIIILIIIIISKSIATTYKNLE